MLNEKHEGHWSRAGAAYPRDPPSLSNGIIDSCERFRGLGCNPLCGMPLPCNAQLASLLRENFMALFKSKYYLERVAVAEREVR